MRNMFWIGIALVCLGVVGVISKAVAEDAKPINGVLIDNACAAKFAEKDNPEAAASKHPKSCAVKPACAASGYAVISGKQVLKLDEKGNELAKAYLAKADTGTKVTVTGTVNGDTLDATDIEPRSK